MSASAPHPPPLQAGEQQRVSRFPVVAWAHKRRHWTVPPLLFPVLLAAGLAVSVFRLQDAAIGIAVVATIMMAWTAPFKWDRLSERWYAITSTALAGLWLSVASYAGVTWIMFWTGLGFIAVWGSFWWYHKRPKALTGEPALVIEWNAWWLHHCYAWGLAGSRVTGITLYAGMEILTVQLSKGRQHLGDVRKQHKLIESALGGYASVGMVSVTGDKHNPSIAYIRIKRIAPLHDPQPWHPGLAITSVMERIALGFSEVGEHIEESLLQNWFILGRTRSGKSNELSIIMAAITGSTDGLVWLIDRRGGRSARPWLAGVDWCAVDDDEISVMLDVAFTEAEARSTYADSSKEQLDPTPDVPAIFLIIDEAYAVTGAGGSEASAIKVSKLASQGSGVAIYVIVATQYGALHESVRSEQTRSNLKANMVFAVKEARHGAFGLGDDYQHLDASRLEEQGAFYYRVGTESSIVPGRGWEFSHDLARQVSRRNGAMPRQPLRLYASQWQQVYDDRWARLPEAFRADAPQCAGISFQAARQASPPAGAPAAATGEAQPPPLADDALGLAEQIESQLTGRADRDLAGIRIDPNVLMSVMDRQKQTFARALEQAPETGVSPAQLVRASGMSRQWVTAQLRDLVADGAADRIGDGLYRAAADRDVWQAMEELKAERAALTVPA